ncbi:MAG TPA: hypothetical protein VFO80_11410 [Sphingomonas sp.]|nr:hypothetical protein [Sphingomonas sp.]
MWFKLVALCVLTLALIVSIIPMRTHAVMFDPDSPPPPQTLRTMFSSMYLPPETVVGILLLLLVAVAIGAWIVRAR